MRRWLIGLGFWSLACGDSSMPLFAAPDREAPDPRSSAAEMLNAAPPAGTASEPPATGPAGAQPSAMPPPETEPPETEAPETEPPETEPPAAASPAAPSVPEVPSTETPLVPPSSSTPSAGEADNSEPPVTEEPDSTPSAPEPSVAEPPANESPSSEAPDDEAPSDSPVVTVSLTFDDTYKPQLEAADILESHGLFGTFYVNSPQLHRATANPSANASLSISDVLGMQARGHDIGGHTLGHLSLTDLPEVERIRELLGDRAQLVKLGVQARSFAYPFGHVEDDPDRSLGRPVLEIARESGYSSARDTNGYLLGNCDARGPESLPPRDPFFLRSVHSVSEPLEDTELPQPPDTAATLLGWVDEVARCGGGWLPLIFHRLLEDCSAPDAPTGGYCFDFAELDRLAEQLATGVRCPDDAQSCYRIRVETVSKAMGVSELAPAPEVPGLRNASLERTLDSGATECLQETMGDGSTALFSRSDIAHSGLSSARVAISAPYVAAAEFRVERDYGECSIFVSEGGNYDLSLYYRAESQSPSPSLRFVSYRLTSDYVWERWTTGNAFTAQAPGSWVRLAFTTPEVPADTIAISFGLRLESAGVLNVDDFDARPSEQR